MKYPHHQAISVAEEILDHLSSQCSRITIAGSIRRQAPEVSDIEILYIPRTGPAQSNIRIATAAKTRGCQCNPYGPGYTRLRDGHQFPMLSEAAVFHFVELPFMLPCERI